MLVPAHDVAVLWTTRTGGFCASACAHVWCMWTVFTVNFTCSFQRGRGIQPRTRLNKTTWLILVVQGSEPDLRCPHRIRLSLKLACQLLVRLSFAVVDGRCEGHVLGGHCLIGLAAVPMLWICDHTNGVFKSIVRLFGAWCIPL